MTQVRWGFCFFCFFYRKQEKFKKKVQKQKKMQSVRNWSKKSVLAPHEYFSLSGFQLGTRYKFFLSCLFLWESPRSFQLFFFLLLVSSLKTFFYFAFLFKRHRHRAEKWPAQEIKVIAAAWWTVREQLCTFKTRKNKVQHFFVFAF